MAFRVWVVWDLTGLEFRGQDVELRTYCLLYYLWGSAGGQFRVCVGITKLQPNPCNM